MFGKRAGESREGSSIGEGSRVVLDMTREMGTLFSKNKQIWRLDPKPLLCFP